MTQRRAFSYIAACTLLAACPHPPAPLVPMPLTPENRDAAVAWSRSTLPRAPMLIRFRWHYQDERVKHAGRGTVRIAPPDSLRFDFAGPLNLGSGAAVIIGDSVAWADPEKNFRSLVPAVPMLWAAFAFVRPPAEGATVFGAPAELVDSLSHKRRVVWRFAQVEDTLDYVVTDSAGRESLLEAEWRRRGKMVAQSRAKLDSLQHTAGARIDFPEGPARFEIIVGMVDTTAVIPPDAWRNRH